MIKNIILVIIIVGAAILVYVYMKKDTGEMKNVEMLAKKGMAVVGEDVTYFNNVQGFYAYPEKEGKYPGVVMIHEWWGLNDNIKIWPKSWRKKVIGCWQWISLVKWRLLRMRRERKRTD